MSEKSMRYKNIKSVLHNFGHSFFSLMNYVDGEYIIDIVGKILREIDTHELRISFPEGRLTPEFDYPETLIKSIKYWADALPRQASSQNVDISKVSDIQLIAKLTSLGIQYHAEAKDDRGVEYSIGIKNTLC